MKKTLLLLAAFFCCAIILTSCGKDETADDWVSYTVNPSETFSGNCLSICEQMRTALKSEMTTSYSMFKRDDAKAITICDRVYNSTKATATASFTIVLSVSKGSTGPDDIKLTTLKTYEY